MMVKEVQIFIVALFLLFVSVHCEITPTSWTTSYCNDGELRLENSTYSYTGGRYTYGGRVELCYSGTFHPICADEGWTENDAAVVCSYMGYHLPYFRAVATGGREFGLSEESPIFQNIMCNGSEYTLSDCSGYVPNNVVGDYCSSGNFQAGVYCIEACSSGEVYFENSTYEYNERYSYGGRVAVCYNDTYYPVCDEGWTAQDSAVVCNYMGYSTPYYRAVTSSSGEFGLSYKTPILQEPMCTGSEYSLKDCPGYTPGNIAGDYCLSGGHHVGVRCIEVCYDGQIQLADPTYSYNGTYMYGGRVEVCSGDMFYPVCNDGWTDEDATVVCTNMGYSSPYYRAEVAANGEFGFSNKVPILQNPRCNGSEYQLSDCEGYALDNVVGDYCLSGSSQAGVHCIEVPNPPCYEGNIHLANSTYSYIDGDYYYGGRVEVCYSGTYHPVCDEGWSDNDAAIVCRYLGYYPPNYRFQPTWGSVFGLSNASTILQNLGCNGTEYSLNECPGYDLMAPDGPYCQSGNYQAGVRCIEVPTPTTPCNDGATRLENDTYEYTDRGYAYGGRVEVCYNNIYYPVCDLGWTERDAVVVCNNVGYYGYAAEVSSVGEFGLSDESPILQTPMCSGTEYYLCNCPGFALNNVVGDYCLSGNHQVGVRCVEESTPSAPCYDGLIRIENATYNFTSVGFSYGGRVEVCYNGTYHPVCDQGWTVNDATVVCNSIGYYNTNFYATATGQQYFGLSDEIPILQNPMCYGYEYALSECYGYQLKNVQGDYCMSGNNQAGAICNFAYSVTTTSSCYDGSIRLENSTYTYYNGTYVYGGRVEICYNQKFYPVCDEGWSDSDAAVICNNLGYYYYYYRGEAATGREYGLSDEVPILQGPMCTGTEYYLSECPGFSLNNVSSDYCLSGKYQAGARCIAVTTPSTPCSDGDTRLENSTYLYTGTNYSYGGRVEVCYSGIYHPVCDEGWTDNDAVVVCNSVGYSSDFYRASATGHKEFGLSDESPILQRPLCHGYELYLSHCAGYSLDDVTGDYCLSGKHQAGVYCTGDYYPTSTMACSDGDTRLENSTYSFKDGVFVYGGRVEVCYRGNFHPVCDEGWTDDDAAVVCNYIGYTTVYHKAVGTGGNQYGLSDEVVVLQSTKCEGSESSLTECPGYHLGEVTGYYCQTGKFQAGATCIRDNTLRCEDGGIRLGNATSGRTAEGFDFVGGRVEVCESGVFGAICDIGWNADTAHAICNLLGYKDRVGVPTVGSHYGSYQGLILFQNVSCVNSDGYDCSGSVAKDPACTSDRIAGVICTATGIDTSTKDPRGGGSMSTHSSFLLVVVIFCLILF